MKSWIWGSVLLIAALVSTLASALTWGHIDWLHVVIISFTLYSGLVLFAALGDSKRRGGLKSECYRPFVSCLVPAHNEQDVIEATVRSLCRMNYRKKGKPNFEVVVVDDGSTDDTLAILQALQRELPLLKIVERKPPNCARGKSAVLNHGLQVSRGEVIAVFDADTRVEPNFLVQCVSCLIDPTVGGVQGRVRIYNANQNLLTLVQEDEFSVMAHMVQVSKDVLNGMTGLGGNGQLTRRTALEEVGGWNELSATEDLDLTLRLLLRGYSVRYCGDAVLWQEAVSRGYPLLRQRVRWAEGFIKCLFDYALPLLVHPMPLFKRIDSLMSLVRCLLPMWALAAYVALGLGFLCGTPLSNSIPWWLMAAASGTFFAVTFLGLYTYQQLTVVQAVWRVVLCWGYNFIWFLAVPLGFVNCLKNLDSIRWDKTEHRGDQPRVSVAGVPAMTLPLAEVVD